MGSHKLTETHLRAQVNRLKTLPRGEDRPWGTPKEPGLREELLRELWRQAESDEDAEQIINRVIKHCKFCPSPAELIEVATAMRMDKLAEREWTNPHSEPVGLCRECSEWGSFGWVFRDGRYELCPQSHDSETARSLIELMNASLAKSQALAGGTK